MTMRPIIQLTKQVVLSNWRELRLPYRVTFALTYRCQFTCVMCGIGVRESSRESELTAEEIGMFFTRAHGFSWINLTGGEITLRPDLLQVVRAIVKGNRYLYLLNFPTNGYLTDAVEDSVREIIRTPGIPKLMVTVSLDGTQELHDRIRNKPGSWERAVETYRRLRKMRSRHFTVYFGMTLQDRNVDAFDATVREVRERIPGIANDDFHVNLLHLSDHYYANQRCGGIRDRERVLRSFRNVRRSGKMRLPHPVAFLEDRYQEMAGQFLRSGRTPVPCQAMNASLFMDPAGTVFPCTIYGRPLGNIRDTGYDLGKLWNSVRRKSIREEVQDGSCPQCWTPCEAYQSILADLLRPRRK